MERELNRDEFYAALGALSRSMETGFSGLNSRLDKLNGKTERHGEDISALKAVQKAVQEIEAREDERGEPRSGRKDSAIGAGVAAGVVGIIELVKVLWK